MITNLKQLRQFFSGKRPARAASRLLDGKPEPGGSYAALPLAQALPDKIQLTGPTRVKVIRTVSLPKGSQFKVLVKRLDGSVLVKLGDDIIEIKAGQWQVVK